MSPWATPSPKASATRTRKPRRLPRLGRPRGRGTGPRPRDFAYANLAVRGRLLQQIVDQQLAPCLALKPDLVTLSAGATTLSAPAATPSPGRKARLRGADPDLGRRHGGAVQRPGHRLFRAGQAPQQGRHLQREPAHRCAGTTPSLPTCGPSGSSATRRCGTRTACTSRRWATTPLRPWCSSPSTSITPWSRLPQGPAPAHLARGPHQRPRLGPRILVPWVVRRLRHQSSGDGVTPSVPPRAGLWPRHSLGFGRSPAGNRRRRAALSCSALLCSALLCGSLLVAAGTACGP